MRLFAALATVTILLGGCDGIGASDEESRSGAVAEHGDEQSGGADETDEESDRE